jgi:hypothetical protein
VKSALEPDSICFFRTILKAIPLRFCSIVGKGLKLKTVSGPEALSGKRSLCLDSMDSSQEWILGAELSKGLKLSPNKGLYGRIQYLITDTANQSAENFLSVAGNKQRFYGRLAVRGGSGPDGGWRKSRSSCPMTRMTPPSGFLARIMPHDHR